MAPDERAKIAGAILPIFFFEGGKEIDPNVAKQLRLEQMTKEELKALKIERTELNMPEVPKDLRHLELSKVSSELLDAMRAKGREFDIAAPGSFHFNRFENLGIEASELDGLIRLKQDSPKIAALEEFLHGTQRQIPSMLQLPREILEIDVKDFMIRHSKLLGLTANDIKVLESLKETEIAKAYNKGLRWNR